MGKLSTGELYDASGRLHNSVEYTNPDGSIGGIVPANMSIPRDVYIARTALVLPGAQLEPGQVIGDGVIVGP